MHVPDGFIPIEHAAAYWSLLVPFLYFSLRWSRECLDDRHLPTMASLAAMVFALQAVNVPVGPASGHLVGATLVAVVMGSPWGGTLVLFLVLLVQALVFADGGITTLGMNALNMGVIGSFSGYYAYAALKKLVPDRAALFSGAWLALLLAAVAAAVELAAAGTFPLVEGTILMGGYHAAIGLIAEGSLTVLVVEGLSRVLPGRDLTGVEA